MLGSHRSGANTAPIAGITSRRGFISKSMSIASWIGAGAFTIYQRDRQIEDSDGDGIPDELERCPSFHQLLLETFGSEQFEGLDASRRDLLVDVRYLGGTHLHPSVGPKLEALFRTNGIHMQWLVHPDRMSRGEFDRRFGNDVRRLLWARDSYYHQEVEPELRNVALQLLVVPGYPSPPKGRVYSPFVDRVTESNGYVNGMNVGNRAVVAVRSNPWEQRRLIMHELAHLVLCHDRSPGNEGVMGSNRRIDLTDSEWHQYRNGLSNIQDTTGYDIVFRRCLWSEYGDEASRRIRCSPGRDQHSCRTRRP